MRAFEPPGARILYHCRMDVFEPRPSLRGGHRMTLFSWGNPRYFPRLPAATRRYFDVDDDARVVAACHWQERPWERATLIALHGLNGSSDAHYMKGLAAKAFARGMNVVRLNQRNCGDTEHLSAGLFHSGLTADAAHLVDELVRVDGLAAIAVAAVSPILEIGECVRALERPGNALYQWNFVKDLKRRIRRKERFRPGAFDLKKLKTIRTVRDFDEVYTAPYFGFRSAEDYYHRASALRIVDRIRVPTLIITAADDPFVPPEPFRDPKVRANPHVDCWITDHGGHCGFVGPAAGEDDGYWAENQIVDFVERHAPAAATGDPARASD